jgi:hypothetical protein
MAKLEDLMRGAAVKGILPDCLVTVVDVKWYGSAAIELTYKDPTGKPMEAEKQLGNEPRDVIGEKCGYDIESKIKADGKLRFIEVKGRGEARA